MALEVADGQSDIGEDDEAGWAGGFLCGCADEVGAEGIGASGQEGAQIDFVGSDLVERIGEFECFGEGGAAEEALGGGVVGGGPPAALFLAQEREEILVA